MVNEGQKSIHSKVDHITHATQIMGQESQPIPASLETLRLVVSELDPSPLVSLSKPKSFSLYFHYYSSFPYPLISSSPSFLKPKSRLFFSMLLSPLNTWLFSLTLPMQAHNFLLFQKK